MGELREGAGLARACAWMWIALTLLFFAGCTEDDESLCGEFPLTEAERVCIQDKVEARVVRFYPFVGDKEGVSLRKFSHQLREIDLGADDLQFLEDLQRVLATLQDGHTQIGLPAGEPRGMPPLALRDIGEEVFVAWSGVEGVEAGDQIVGVDGELVADTIEELLPLIAASTPEARRRSAVRALLSGPRSEAVGVRFLRDGESRELLLERLEVVQAVPRSPEGRRFGDVGYIRVSSFAFVDDAEVFDGLLGELRDTRALILDLRENGGGRGLNPNLLLGRFIEEELPDFELQKRDGEVKARLKAIPRGEPYRGRLVVLSDVFTYSAANYLVHRVRFHDLGVVIGERSGGGSAQRIQVELVDGLPFIYSRRRLVDPEGVDFEQGLEPDIAIELTPQDLREGLGIRSGDPATDGVLAEALRLIEEDL